MGQHLRLRLRPGLSESDLRLLAQLTGSDGSPVRLLWRVKDRLTHGLYPDRGAITLHFDDEGDAEALRQLIREALANRQTGIRGDEAVPVQ